MNKDIDGDDDNTIDGQVPLVTQQQVLLTISFNKEVLLERRGKQWVDVNDKMNANQIEQVVRAWQQSEAEVFKTLPLVNQANFIEVILGLDTENIHYSIYPTKDALYLYHHQQDIWLQLPTVFVQQLIPESILRVREPV